MWFFLRSISQSAEREEVWAYPVGEFLLPPDEALLEDGSPSGGGAEGCGDLFGPLELLVRDQDGHLADVALQSLVERGHRETGQRGGPVSRAPGRCPSCISGRTTRLLQTNNRDLDTLNKLSKCSLRRKRIFSNCFWETQKTYCYIILKIFRYYAR